MDPHSFFVDPDLYPDPYPDPAVLLNADPDPESAA